MFFMCVCFVNSSLRTSMFSNVFSLFRKCFQFPNILASSKLTYIVLSMYSNDSFVFLTFSNVFDVCFPTVPRLFQYSILCFPIGSQCFSYGFGVFSNSSLCFRMFLFVLQVFKGFPMFPVCFSIVLWSNVCVFCQFSQFFLALFYVSKAFRFGFQLVLKVFHVFFCCRCVFQNISWFSNKFCMYYNC